MIAISGRAWPLAVALACLLVPVAPATGRAGEDKAPAQDEAVNAPAESEAVAAPVPVAVAARGGRDLLAAAESSKLVVVGRVSAIEKIDLHGYAADFKVDQVLRGKVKPGADLRIAWEELAKARPVRFEDGQRIFVCLDPPPNYTLWQKRFPDNLGDIWAVSREGEAFWREPDAPTLHELEHYLALGKEGRDDPAALAYIVDIVGIAPEMIALQALGSLDTREGLTAKLSEGSARALGAIAADRERPAAVRRGVLLLISRMMIKAARDGIVPITQPGESLRAEALSTLGKLDGGLPQDLVKELIDDENGDLRAVGTIYLRGDETEETLVRLAGSDSSPGVRVAAVSRLLEEHGVAVFDEISHALGDEDPSVRLVVARDVATLGQVVVPKLEELANTGTERQAEGAVLALTMVGGEAGQALLRMYQNHENQKIRGLAGIALGHVPGHKH